MRAYKDIRMILRETVEECFSLIVPSPISTYCRFIMALGYFVQAVIYSMLSCWILLFLYSSLPSPPKGVSLVRKHFKILPEVLQRIEGLFIGKTLLQDGYHKVG